MKINFAPTGKNWLFLTALLALAVYFLGVRQRLGAVSIAQIELIVLGGLALILVVTILLLLFTLLAFALTKKRANWLQRLRGQMIFTGMIIILLAVIVAASQWMAHTPPDSGRGRSTACEQYYLSGKNKTGRRGSMADYSRA
jgi:hypothetical protein